MCRILELREFNLDLGKANQILEVPVGYRVQRLDPHKRLLLA